MGRAKGQQNQTAAAVARMKDFDSVFGAHRGQHNATKLTTLFEEVTQGQCDNAFMYLQSLPSEELNRFVKPDGLHETVQTNETLAAALLHELCQQTRTEITEERTRQFLTDLYPGELDPGDNDKLWKETEDWTQTVFFLDAAVHLQDADVNTMKQEIRNSMLPQGAGLFLGKVYQQDPRTAVTHLAGASTYDESLQQISDMSVVTYKDGTPDKRVTSEECAEKIEALTDLDWSHCISQMYGHVNKDDPNPDFITETRYNERVLDALVLDFLLSWS